MLLRIVNTDQRALLDEHATNAESAPAQTCPSYSATSPCVSKRPDMSIGLLSAKPRYSTIKSRRCQQLFRAVFNGVQHIACCRAQGYVAERMFTYFTQGAWSPTGADTAVQAGCAQERLVQRQLGSLEDQHGLAVTDSGQGCGATSRTPTMAILNPEGDQGEARVEAGEAHEAGVRNEEPGMGPGSSAADRAGSAAGTDVPWAHDSWCGHARMPA
jgi:hypothetical protein